MHLIAARLPVRVLCSVVALHTTADSSHVHQRKKQLGEVPLPVLMVLSVTLADPALGDQKGGGDPKKNKRK